MTGSLSMRHIKALGLFLSVSVVLAGGASAQTRDIGSHGELLDRIAAIVNDGVVLKSELDSQLESVTKRLEEQKVELPSPSVLKQQVLERLVLQEIQQQRAAKVGLTIPDEQLNGALQEIAARNKIPFDKLPTALESQGIDYKQYRESMRKEMVLSTLRQRDVIAKINVTPRELDQYLARQQNAATNDEFNVSHILLSLPQAATPQQLADITKKAADLAARARHGEDFGQLAIANSNGQTALDGGQLGWRKGSQMPQFILDLITKMKPGEISDPVRTPSGFHIVKLNERRGGEAQVIVNQIHVRHILMKPNELDDDETAFSRARISPASLPPPPKIRARRRTAAIWAGPARAPSCRNSTRPSPTSRIRKSASPSRAVTAGTSCRCSARAPTTAPTTCAGSGPTRPSAKARRTRKRSCGCGVCVMRHSSKPRCSAHPAHRHHLR
jgi:peptidyl-prolyl cis-trans isomerase SurA